MNVRAWLLRWRGGGAVRQAVQARAAEVLADMQARNVDLTAKRASVMVSTAAARKTIATQLQRASAALATATPPPPEAKNGAAHA